MRIEPRPDFRDARSIPRKFDQADPRAPQFKESEIVVDLRSTEFLRPAAALWCAIYPLLVMQAGSQCRLLVPLNFGVSIYLKSIGLFEILRSHAIQLDDRDIPETSSRQVIIPLTRFDSETEAENLANRAMEALKDTGVGAANIYPLVSEIFGELAVNAVQHAESPIGAYGLIQFYALRGGEYFVCCVADGGIGVRSSLERNPALRAQVAYDWDALKMAVGERVSGTGDSHRGIGLFGVAEDMREPGRRLIIHSGLGGLSVNSESDGKAKRQNLFPGTLAYVSIHT